MRGDPLERMAVVNRGWSVVRVSRTSGKALGERYAAMTRSTCASVAFSLNRFTAKRRAARVTTQKSSYRPMRARSHVYSSCFARHSRLKASGSAVTSRQGGGPPKVLKRVGIGAQLHIQL